MNGIFSLIESCIGMLYRFQNRKKQTGGAATSLFLKGYSLSNNWEKMNKEGKTFQKFFEDNKMKRIAIYGFGEIGKRLYRDLQNLDIDIAYVVDQNADRICLENVKVVDLTHELEPVDVIIVTPIQFFEEIEETLRHITKSDIVSLEEIMEYCV